MGAAVSSAMTDHPPNRIGHCLSAVAGRDVQANGPAGRNEKLERGRGVVEGLLTAATQQKRVECRKATHGLCQIGDQAGVELVEDLGGVKQGHVPSYYR